jgi:protein TonB
MFLSLVTQQNLLMAQQESTDNANNQADIYFTDDSVEVHNAADEMPRFPGCEDLDSKFKKHHCARKKLLDYVYGNLTYPLEARKKGIQGMVVVRFFIDTVGRVQNIEIIKDIGGGTDRAAKNVFEKMNKEGKRWIPGKHKGEIVNVDYTMPIRFKLSQ